MNDQDQIVEFDDPVSQRLKDAVLGILAALPDEDVAQIRRRHILLCEGSVGDEFGSCETAAGPNRAA
jgi:hypothetical protein